MVVVIAAIEAAGLPVKETGFGHWVTGCPCHQDTEPSLHVDVLPHQDWGRFVPKIRCHVCGANGGAVCDALGVPHRHLMSDHSQYGDQPPPRLAPLPSPSDLADWRRALWADAERRDYLRHVRGLGFGVVHDHGIGWDAKAGTYTLPVFDDSGALVNLRRYRTDPPEGVSKMAGLTGRSIQLYPSMPPGWVLLVEGEWDALVGRQAGLPTVTSTGGVQGWKAGWDDLFVGRKVAICFDCDEPGRSGAAKRARMLRDPAAEVRVIDLAPDRDDGYDLSDYLGSGRARLRKRKRLFDLIRATAPVEPLGAKR